MSNINREIDFGNLTTALDFVFSQAFKDVHTCLPGIVESYTGTTRRAKIIPAIQLLLTDESKVTRSPIVDVPVVFPSGGGFTLLFPLKKDDSVLLVFSQRGLTDFKKSFKEASPEPMRILSEIDAIAIPGFGALSVTLATTTGAALQKENADTYIKIESNSIELKATNVTVTSTNFKHNTTNVGDTHTHTYTTPQHAAGSGNTGGPA